MGAAGRDFHDFNVVYRNDPGVEVVAFTATQIPGIAGRRYPAELAGPLVRRRASRSSPRAELERLIRERDVDDGRLRLQRRQPRDRDARGVARPGGRRRLHAARAATGRCSRAAGRSSPSARRGPAPARARRRATWPACSPSAASRRSSSATRCRTATSSPSGSSASRRTTDLDRYETTIEEREEYEPHLDAGRVVYAGVDYEAILREAELEADVILWDGGNNDFPFYRPDLYVVVADPLRPGDERRYHPGETNVRMADVVIINKIDSAEPAAVEAVRASIARAQPAGRRS